MDEKLQKVLARRGLGSRREMERWIDAGRIRVNGKTAKLGDRVSDKDTIQLDGRTLKKTAESSIPRVLLYHKPLGEVCSRKDDEGRPTVYDRLPRLTNQRWISVGRLDVNTTGLLLFTTDGELANGLMHPSSKIDREYLVRVNGEVDDSAIQNLLRGVELDDGPARFTDIQEGRGRGDGSNRWFYVALMEGRNREVRRLWESQGVKVSRLKRVRFGNVVIPSSVKAGQWKEFNETDIRELYERVRLPVPAAVRGKPGKDRRQRSSSKKSVDKRKR